MLKLALLASLIGCTPGMHKAYRAGVVALGAGAQVLDTRQTIWALEHGESEANPLLGEHPTRGALVAGASASIAVSAVGWRLLEAVNVSDAESEWVKDILATVPLAIEGFCVAHNYPITGGFR